MIFVADGFLQKASIGIMGNVFVDILKGMWKAITMIVFIIALTKVMGCIGMTSVIEIPGQI